MSLGTSFTRRGYLATVGAASLSGCLGSSGGDVLQVGVVPDVDPDSAIEANTPLATYLEETLGRTVELDTTADYAGLVRAMSAEQVDLGYFGGVSYILAHQRAGAEPVVVGKSAGTTLWESAFVVPEGSDLADMAAVTENASDLSLVFGDPLSTSGTVMPSYYLETEYGLDPEAAFESVTHVGAHDATARTIQSGGGDLGALNARIYDALKADGKISGVREIWRSPGFPDYPWAVAPTVSKDTRTAIQEAFLALDDRDRAEILEMQNVDAYVAVDHEAFTSLQEAVEMAGIEDFESDG